MRPSNIYSITYDQKSYNSNVNRTTELTLETVLYLYAGSHLAPILIFKITKLSGFFSVMHFNFRISNTFRLTYFWCVKINDFWDSKTYFNMNVIMCYSPFKKIAPFNVIYGSILVFVRFIQMCKLLVRYFKKNSTKGIHFLFFILFMLRERGVVVVAN